MKALDYKIYTKDNPYEWTGTYEELLETYDNSKNPFERSNIPGYVYIKYKCKDCGKEEVVQVVSIRTYHSKCLKGIKDPISDDLLCKSCKTKRIYQRDFGVDNPQQIKEVMINNKKTFYKNHPYIYPYQEEPIIWDKTWEDFTRCQMKCNQKVKFKCVDCEEEVVLTYGALRYRKNFTLNPGLYCKHCQLKHSTYELDENILNRLPIFKGSTVKELKDFMEEEHLIKDYSVSLICSNCGKKDNIRIGNLLLRRDNELNLCSGCYMSKSLDNLSILGSSPEKEIIEYIKTFYDGPIEEHNRSLLDPLEVDIYLPELKFGIEFNGDY